MGVGIRNNLPLLILSKIVFMPLLDKEFYQDENVVAIARALLGKALFSDVQGHLVAGIITETEAYSHREKGCHAYNLHKTVRNASMFEAGGVSYVYLCYGIHEMFNIVTNVKGLADAILIRSIRPYIGEEVMSTRRKGRDYNGPGKVTVALGINRIYNGVPLYTKSDIWIEDRPMVEDEYIQVSPRIGIDYAGEDALLPWRFTVKS
jgi:DNA-3-methyladenine glycosylase